MAGIVGGFLSLSLSLSSSLCRRESECLRYGASVVYISGCSEDKTNGILHKYPSSSLLAHTFLSPFLALCFALASSVSLSETSPRKDRHLSPRMFRLGKERERGREREKGGRTAFERETNTPLRDFASSFDDFKMGKVSSFRWLSLIRIPATKVEPS